MTPSSPAVSRAAAPFRSLPECIRLSAQETPSQAALIQDDAVTTYAALDAYVEAVAAALQRDGLQPTDVIAVCAGNSRDYAAVFLGALRAGVAVAPLAPSATPAQLADMLRDSDARLLFIDASTAALFAADAAASPVRRISLDGRAGGEPFAAWLAAQAPTFTPMSIDPAWPFNLIYSSGTTGAPKGIVQSHAMRWAYTQRAVPSGYGPQTITLISTPLYSNTTLVSFFPTLALGGTVVLMAKFDAGRYLELAQRYRVTHTMLVPVQYQRLMAHPDFDRFDLSAFVAKSCTSAPFAADLKAEILRRWPGALNEFYGLTEGGGTCILAAREHPDKLATVGRPAPGHDIRLIDAAGREVPVGEVGEVVGASPSMMTGYHKQPDKTAEAEWFDAQGKRFIRTGDIGRFDADGFLTLLDRKKDLIISGGFNVYPGDIEAVLAQHPAVREVAVIGVPSERWGETPVACVALRDGATLSATDLREWANTRLGKVQRLAAVALVAELPRSAIGKILKRQLRAQFEAAARTG